MALNYCAFEGNAGVDLRTTFKALIGSGRRRKPTGRMVRTASFFDPTDAFLFSFAGTTKRSAIIAWTPPTAATTLRVVKSYLAANFAIAFGFSVPSSCGREADISFALSSIPSGVARPYWR